MNYINEKAKIGYNTIIGKFTIIEDAVVIGDGCSIGHNVIIHKGTIIGTNVRIDDNAVIGKQPLRAANSIFKAEIPPPAVIGDECIIGTGAILYSGCCIKEKVFIADLATIRENVTIGEMTIIGRGCAIENFCSIGCSCKLETNVYITAFSTIEDNIFIAPGVITSNDNYAGRSRERLGRFKGVTVKKGGRLGANATILPGKTIGKDGLAAAGSVVTHDVEPGTIVAGNPAVYFKKVPPEQLLGNQ